MSKVKNNKLIKKIIKQPNYCECAYVVKRPISNFPWLKGVSSNQTLNKFNLELSHEHIIFSESKENIGFGAKGYFSDQENIKYREQSKCYNAKIIRRALREFFENKKLIKKEVYNIFKNNCQHFIENILKYSKR